MPRAKAPWTMLTMAELCRKHNIDPGEKLIQLASETITDEDTGKPIPVLVAHMGPRDGWRMYFELCKYLDSKNRPTLRTTEHTGTGANIFNVTIKQFGMAKEAQTIELDPPKQINHGNDEPDPSLQVEAEELPDPGVDVLPE